MAAASCWFNPRTSVSSAAVACLILATDPKWCSRESFLTRPIPGIRSSSLAVVLRSLSRRW